MKTIPQALQSAAEKDAAQQIVTKLAGLDPVMAERIIKKVGAKFDFEYEATRLQALAANPLVPMDLLRESAKPVIEQAEKERKQLDADLTHLHIESAMLKHHLDALQELEDWSQKPPKLIIERNDCSRLHKLKEAALKGNLIDGTKKGGEIIAPKVSVLNKASQTFVVKHDWARAFEHAADWRTGEFKLPYDLCCFEFRLDGRTVILWAMNTEKVADIDRDLSFTAFVECGDCWYSPPETPLDDFEKYLWDQVRAICISLDAEIAVHTVERAPHALNEKRLQAGRVPLSDFHVVDLAKRHRVANPSVGSGEGTKKRLHFRRGHWRHYETSKTWVKWCLVGNPDLGFISKSYTL